MEFPQICTNENEPSGQFLFCFWGFLGVFGGVFLYFFLHFIFNCAHCHQTETRLCEKFIFIKKIKIKNKRSWWRLEIHQELFLQRKAKKKHSLFPFLVSCDPLCIERDPWRTAKKKKFLLCKRRLQSFQMQINKGEQF